MTSNQIHRLKRSRAQPRPIMAPIMALSKGVIFILVILAGKVWAREKAHQGTQEEHRCCQKQADSVDLEGNRALAEGEGLTCQS